jgi:nitrite reductase/ring-hydroxylating ferredoxin subunit
MTGARPSRRIVFQGLSALGVAAVLAGCGGERDQPRASTTSEADSASPAPTEAAPSRKPKKKHNRLAPNALAAADEIPVGGGIILTDARIVITQPKRGEFRGFSAVCTHEGQTVGRVSGSTITCLAHGSQYDAATGDVTMGPATAGLDPVPLRVRGGAILRA